ncbi:MAG: multidrug effflux MFS transporter [Pseudomonadota bacterium]
MTDATLPISGAAEPTVLSGTSDAPRPHLVTLIAVTATGPLALNMFVPSMPSLAADFGVSYGTAQLTLTLFLVAVALGQLFWGPVSDRFGRRPMVLLGMALFALGSLLAWLATSIEVLLAARALQAFGGSAGMVLTRAIVRDMHAREKSASMMGYIMMAMSVAPLIAPLIGGILDAGFGWRASFVVLTLSGLMVLALAMFDLHETNHRRQCQSAGAFLYDLWTLLREPRLIGWAMTMSLSSGMFFAFLAGAPYVMVTLLDRTPAEYGLYFALISLGYMFGNFLSGRFSERCGPNRMIRYGLIAGIIGASLLLALFGAGVVAPWSLFLPVGIIAIANGLTLPSAIANIVSVRPDLAGAASGLGGSIQIGFGALATIGVGLGAQGNSALPLAVLIFAFAILAIVAYLVTPKRMDMA